MTLTFCYYKRDLFAESSINVIKRRILPCEFLRNHKYDENITLSEAKLVIGTH